MNNVENFGKAAGYGLYIAGASIPVAIARIAMSIYYIAVHAINRTTIEAIKNQKVQQQRKIVRQMEDENVQSAANRHKENRAAERATSQAQRNFQNAEGLNKVGTLFSFFGKSISEATTKTINTIGEHTDDIVTDVKTSLVEFETVFVESSAALFMKKEEGERDLWVSQLVRGLIELIPIFGAIYYTVQDNKKRSVQDIKGFQDLLSSEPGFLGYKDVKSLLSYEKDMSLEIKNYVKA